MIRRHQGLARLAVVVWLVYAAVSWWASREAQRADPADTPMERLAALAATLAIWALGAVVIFAAAALAAWIAAGFRRDRRP